MCGLGGFVGLGQLRRRLEEDYLSNNSVEDVLRKRRSSSTENRYNSFQKVTKLKNYSN